MLFIQYSDRKARELWNQVLDKFPKFFEGLNIEPALVHGDLWGGNVAENDNGPGIISVHMIFLQSEVM